MEFIEIEIKDFAKYLKRSDIKTPTWFAVEHNLLLHPDFFDVKGDEVKAFFWILGTAIHLNSKHIKVFPDLCASQIGIKKSSVHLCIEKLKGKRFSVRDCTGDFGPTCTTGQDSTHKNSTHKNSTGIIQGKADEPEHLKLVAIWNEHRGILPAISKVTDARKKKMQKAWPQFTAEEWTSIVKRVSENKFLTGQTDKSDWKASFDWLLGEKEKTPNYIRVHEGNYDNRTAKKIKPSEMVNIKWDNQEAAT